MSIIRAVYAVLLRLYPDPFRERFGREMQAVFAAALVDAWEQGPAAVIRLCLGELWALPGCIIREHLHERGSRAVLSQSTPQNESSARLRRLARSLGLLIVAPILIVIASPAPPHNPALIVLLLVTHSVAVAWFREDLGGRLLVGSGLLLGLTAMLSFITGSGVPSHPVPGREVMIGLTGGGIGLLFGAPVVLTGLLFVRVGRRAANPDDMALRWFAFKTDKTREVPLARCVIRAAALLLSLALAWIALQTLLNGHFIEDRPVVGGLTQAYYTLTLLMPLAVLVALRWERCGAFLILTGGALLGVLAGWAMAAFDGNVSLILMAGVMHAMQYGPIGIMFWLIAQRDGGQIVPETQAA